MTMTSSSTQDWLGADSLIRRMGRGFFFLFKIICLKNDHIHARFRLSSMFYHDLLSYSLCSTVNVESLTKLPISLADRFKVLTILI